MLVERQNRLEALLSVFATDDAGIAEESRMQCVARWQALQPLLEGCVRSGEVEADPDLPGGNATEPRPSSVMETVVDSQDFVMEEGSRVQVVVVDDTGSQRLLTQQERDQIELDELVEDEAAEGEREEEQRQWSLFAASNYRSWEEWAVSADLGGPHAKRARVQILVQGLGGRIVRDKNWLVPLRDGEQLSYSVRVQPATEDTDEAPHPDAAPSGLSQQGQAPGNLLEAQDDERDWEGPASMDNSMLPVTGWTSAPVLEDQSTPSKELDVVEFVLCPLGLRFYREWVKGKVTCRLIGQRFGYGVLGKFFAIREEAKLLQQELGLPADDAEAAAREAMTKELTGVMVSEAPVSTERAAPGENADGHGSEIPGGLDSAQVELISQGHVPPPTSSTATGSGVPGELDPAQVDLLPQGNVPPLTSSTVPVSSVAFADVLQQLESPEQGEVADVAMTEEIAAEPAAERAAGSSTGTSERASSKQTNLSHWLK